MSIRKRLMLLVLAVWLPAAAGFGLLAWLMHQEEAAATRRQVEQYAQSINSLVERELDKRVVLARSLAASNAARDADFARFHEEARSATHGTGDWALLADAEWQLANTKASFPFEPVRRARSAPLSERDPYMVFVPQTPVARRPAIAVFVPVPGTAPQRYNVGVSFEPATLQRVLGTRSEPFNALAAVVNSEQLIMARSRDPEKFVGASASPTFKDRILSGGTGFAESTTLDGVRSMTYLTTQNAYGWVVVLSVPIRELDAAAQRTSAKAIGAAALLLLIGLGTAVVWARRIGRTVDALQTAAAQLGNNTVPPRLQTGVTEVDEVADALHAAGVKAHEANATLALRVQEAVDQAKEAQSKLLQGQKLEIIGRLTAGVAHDFNNLLQTVATAHHLLGKQLTEGPVRRTLEGAMRATSKAADLVKQLMTFGRVQTLQPGPVNIADVVLKGQELTSKAVGERITLSAALEPGLPDVYVDPVQFEIALLNLVFNARDAMPAGGHITLSARLTTPDETHAIGPGRFVRLEVADTGAGMSEDVQAQAFEPYFTTKPVGAGSGIGLAQVHSFARQSGGDITLSSELGHGTQMRLFLPVALTAAVQREAASPAAPTRQRLKVLMVEDDVLVSSLTTALLGEEGYDVQLCHTADEAAAVLQAGAPFDVLFTDVVMPGTMNGIDLVKWCQAHRPELPAVVTTGYAENLSSVNTTVLRKPYEIDTLLQALQDAHRQADDNHPSLNLSDPGTLHAQSLLDLHLPLCHRR